MRDNRRTLLIIGLILVVGGFIVAMHREPIYEYSVNPRTGKRVSAVIGSYQPYDWAGWPALGLGVVILVSAASVKVMK